MISVILLMFQLQNETILLFLVFRKSSIRMAAKTILCLLNKIGYYLLNILCCVRLWGRSYYSTSKF